MARLDGPRWKTGCAVFAAIVLTSTGCAHVQQEEFDDELAQIRQEMEENNNALEQRIGEQIRSLEDRVDRRIAMLEADLDELREEFQVTVDRYESALRFAAPVHFGFDEAELDEDGREVLDRFAEVVLEYYDETLITVEGFTDPAGDPNYNVWLGEQRAQSVVEHLADAGLPRDRLRAVSYGEQSERQVLPGAQGPGEAGRENRRVAMVIDFDPSAFAGPFAAAGDSRR